MKILLVLPATEALRVTPENPQVPNRAMLRFSVLSLTALAAVTPEEHQVTLCDENVELLDLESDADLVGISFMTALTDRALEIAAHFRKRGKQVVAGGFHPTLNPEEVLPHFDAVVVGDGECSWPSLLQDAAAGNLRKIYRSREPFDLAKMPHPRIDLLEDKKKHYITTAAVQTGRGCRHACTYCSITAFHQNRHRSRPVPDVIRDLRRLPRSFIFVDDNIIADPDYARELFTAMIPLKKRWVSQCSLQVGDDPELMRLAHRAGCRGLFIGIETTSTANLDAVGKAFNHSRKIEERVAAIQDSGIGVVAGMIVGMDRDDPTVFQKTLKFLQKTGINGLQLNILTPLPGTPLFTRMEKEGRITSRNWSHYDYRHTVFEPRGMTRNQLQQGADWLYRQFYRLDRILVRTLRTLFQSGPVPAYLCYRLNMTYRYDNLREGIRGRNPAREQARPTTWKPVSPRPHKSSI